MYWFFLLYAVFNLRKSVTTVTSFQICKQVHKFDLWVQLGFVNQLLRSLSLATQGSSHLNQWWVQMDSNHRPHAYQACALTSWAMNPFCRAFARNKKITLAGWWRLAGSNRWPPACRAGALPAELNPHVFALQMPLQNKSSQDLRACLLKMSRRKRESFCIDWEWMTDLSATAIISP